MSEYQSNPLAIKIENLNKNYITGKYKFLGSKGILTSNKKDLTTIQAVNNINLEIKKNDRIGLLGHNGSGKSTLMRMMSNITTPTSGTVLINGKVSSVLQGRVGFHPELTGYENIFLTGSLYGMGKKKIDQVLPKIIKFSELEKFMSTPLKRYSDGMNVKLACSILCHLDGNILILDEILAMVDQFFRKKFINKLKEKIATEKITLIFVSHQIENIRELCNRIVILNNGKIYFNGNLEEGINTYQSLL